MKSDIQIAQETELEPIGDIAARLGIEQDDLQPYALQGQDFLKAMERFRDRPDGKLIPVTAINPTPAGEGKTTTTVGLGDALNRLGKRS